MIHTGDLLENPVTGERLLFHRTSRDTRGEAVVFEAFVEPGGLVAATHLHPHQEERFAVVAGAVVADATFDTVRLPFPPAWLQRLGLALLAPVGWLLGYEPLYPPPAPAGPVPAPAYAVVPVRWDETA
jgi:hypothetical protein